MRSRRSSRGKPQEGHVAKPCFHSLRLSVTMSAVNSLRSSFDLSRVEPLEVTAPSPGPDVLIVPSRSMRPKCRGRVHSPRHQFLVRRLGLVDRSSEIPLRPPTLLPPRNDPALEVSSPDGLPADDSRTDF